MRGLEGVFSLWRMKPISDFLSALGSTFATPAWATILAGFFVIFTLALSSYLIFEHLNAYKNPEEQKFLLGVVLMVPTYALESYVSLVNPSLSVDCGILRDCYEAFAMYCFGRYFVACLGGEEAAIEFMIREGAKANILENVSEKGVIYHHFPLKYILKPWRLGRGLYQLIKFGIFQYMIIKTVTATLSFILEALGAYCDGEFKWDCGYPYMTIVLSFSQYWALYCLIAFYTAIKDELAYMKPLAKFLVFKSIVFLTWWQGVIIALMFTLGLVKSPIAQGLQFKTSIQNFIICIEMAVASVVHLYVFPAKPYELLDDPLTGSVTVLGDYAALNPIDPDEVKDSRRPSKLKLPDPDLNGKSSTNIKESVRDIVLGGGEYIVNDFKFTVNHAVVPVEKSIYKLNEKIHKIRKKAKDDNFVPSPRIIHGIDDPLLNNSGTYSGKSKGKKVGRPSGYRSADSGGESDRAHGGYEIHGGRWIVN